MKVLLLISILCLLPVTVIADPAPIKADRLLVEKSARRLVLLADGEAIRTYAVALGRNPMGHKEKQGDMRTPEGEYVIDYRKEDSSYHLALRISYPSAADRARAERLGVSPGGSIMIHGLPNGYGDVGNLHRLTDWTRGCIAVTNEEMEEIWALVPTGVPIEIRP